ncbi:CRISPR-associated protein, family [Enhygromyxa salina]|uniref:CRISPR-associated protein, family n=1 Tax=Enhygromyxa salina TaxID=215803 RepID=A0A2S9XEW9_9BACT|nr:type I-U CRISPR-associated protein Csb2 [Enhygromyxa salina]PRP91416.1 CRISPR-associated protein, family [Enhygromyxa salina]
MPDAFPLPELAAVDERGQGVVLGVFGSWTPSLELALPIAERVRVALMRASDSRVPWQICGKDEHGRPRRGHEHLYVLPFSSAGGARIDRVLLWADKGLEDSTLAVVERLADRGGWVQLRGRERLRLELLGVGAPEVIAPTVPRGVLGPARIWRSATSFVPPRFTKVRGGRVIDTAQEQVLRLASEVLGLAPVGISALEREDGEWRGFRQRRVKDPRSPRRAAGGWVLRFSAPVRGPVVLGYGAHYGLGRFEAEPGDERR